MKNASKPVLLVCPPQTDPTQPYSSLPVLTGFLRRKGYNTIQKDLSIELLDALLTARKLREARESAILMARDIEMHSSDGYIARFDSIISFADYIINHIVKAKELMRDNALFYDLKSYMWALSVLSLACELVSLPCHPSTLTLSEYKCAAQLTFRGLLEATANQQDNLFFPLLQQKTLPEILALDPLLVGISVTFHHQIVPAFTLSRLIKLEAPDVHVNIGGAIIHYMLDKLLEDPTCFRFADSYVIGEGETALDKLSENLLLNKDLLSVPNLISEVNGRAHFSTLDWHEDLNGLPCPDYDGLNLDRYLSPEPIFLLSSSRGCYHGKCAFCDVAMNTRQIFRQRDSNKLTEDISILYHKNDARHFFFCDNAMHPKKMLDVARIVTDTFPDVGWGAEARFEKVMTPEFISALQKGGCRLLGFGFESASQRILDAMNKHNSAQTNLQILQDCAAGGIAVNLQTFIGFPTETQEEAWETIDFLFRNEHNIAQCGFVTFRLQKGTPIHKSPQDYGLKSISQVDRENILPSYSYIASAGMTAKEAQNVALLGKAKLKPLYSTRMRCVAPLHHLLFHSHYNYDTIRALWKTVDEPLWEDVADMEELVVTCPSTLIISDLVQEANTWYQVLNCETAQLFSLSETQKQLLDLCDGSKKISEIAENWTIMQEKNLEKQIFHTAEAFSTLREFLRNGLIKEQK